MTDRADVRLLAQLPEDRVPPRRNGELVFGSPWESRVFGLAVALSERGALRWNDFRSELIAQIGAWERGRANDPDEDYHYYAHWLTALERSVLAAGLIDAAPLAAEVERLLAAPPDSEHH